MNTANLLPVAMLCLLSFLAAAGMAWRFSSPKSIFYVLDHPNERSLHIHPTPRTGGIAVLAAIVIAGSTVVYVRGDCPTEWTWFVSTGAGLAAVSLLDDWIGLPVSVRLVTHLVVAALVIGAGFGRPLPGAGMMPLITSFFIASAFLLIVWMINLYNFMDGMDGLAGGMAVIGFGAFAWLGWRAGHDWFAISSTIVAGASAGFLMFNFPPARIFLGDVGSTTLGFFAGCFILWGYRDNLFPISTGILVFSPFVADASVTLMRRLTLKDKIWQAHRKHYYQRLVQLGWSHRRTVLWEYVVMIACALSALIGLHVSQSTQWIIILLWVSMYALMAGMVSFLEKRNATTR